MPTTSESRAAAASARLLVMSEQLGSRTDRVSIGELLDGLGRASLGLGLMVPSLLAMIPLPGPFGVLFGTMIGAIAVQVMMGETRLRLPRFLAGRTVPPAAVGTALRRFATPLQWAERLSTPRRLLPLTGRVARVVLAAPLLIMAMMLALPIPLGNGLPAIAVIVFALGFMERDGLAILAALGLCVVALVWTVALILFGAEIFGWLLSFLG
ncbi:MAG: exopolysaccharide biosynthesis protein [Alphaproteobacteria bacterium]|nr:exopolysaccharide biosynthesis protein [Alphaproteobacteria bacterium]